MPEPVNPHNHGVESARRSARAYEVLDLYVDRAERMVRSAPPSVVAPVMRLLLDIARLEGGQSTANVAHAGLTPADRRARILKLAAAAGELIEGDA